MELLEGCGFDPHLLHPLLWKAIALAQLKNAKIDAAILAQPLRADLLPEAWIGPPAVRHLRALLRPRVQPVRLRTLRRGSARRASWRPGPGSPRPPAVSDRAIRHGHISP